MMKKMDVRMPGTGPGTQEVSNKCRKVCAEPFTGIHSLPLFCLVLPHSLHMPHFLSFKFHTFSSKLYPKKPPCSLTFACFTP